MSINFTNGTPPEKENPAEQEKKPSPQEKVKERKRQQLLNQQKNVQKQLDSLKTSITKPLRSLVKILIAQDDPNDDPNELFRQIRPLLSKMGLANIADPSKTELVPGKTKGKESLYKIVLRRSAQIGQKEIDRIKREEKALETVQWSEKAIEFYLWHPYIAPEKATPPGSPMTPGASA
jgi:hypothetical protein